MAKLFPDAQKDVALTAIFTSCTKVIACSAQPTTYAEAATTYALADATVTFGGDFTLGNGDTSGRKITCSAQTGITIDAADDADHIAFTDGSSTLLYVTTCPTKALSTPGTVDFSAVDILEITDPA